MKKNLIVFGALCALATILSIGCKQPADGGGGTVAYKTGDTGPGGGKIFYVKEEPGDGWQYLEVAPADLPGTYVWDTTPTLNTVMATKMSVGSGKSNTNIIITALGSAGAAASAAKAYRGGGKDDWFLPSLSELSALNGVKSQIGGFGDKVYWSSSQVTLASLTTAYEYDFDSGASSYMSNNKKYAYSVRPVRSF